MTLEEQLLDGLRVMVTGNMEITRDFVDKHESRHLAPLFGFQCFDSGVSDILGREHALLRSVIIWVK